MPRRMTALALTAMLAATGTATTAQDAQGFVLRGMGALGCGTLISALDGEQSGDAAARLIAWLSGYVSHANRADGTVHDVVPYSDVDGLATVVARVCAANTEAQVETVTASVLATLAPLAVRAPEAPVELRRGEAAMPMRPSVLQALQKNLIERGLLPGGSADGVYGEQTADAVATFQDQADLAPTGLPDAWTVFLLQAEQ